MRSRGSAGSGCCFAAGMFGATVCDHVEEHEHPCCNAAIAPGARHATIGMSGHTRASVPLCPSGTQCAESRGFTLIRYARCMRRRGHGASLGAADVQSSNRMRRSIDRPDACETLVGLVYPTAAIVCKPCSHIPNEGLGERKNIYITKGQPLSLQELHRMASRVSA